MWLILILVILSIFLEKGVFPSFFPTGFIPQQLLILVITLGIWRSQLSDDKDNWNSLYLDIFISGIIYDLMSDNYLGVTALINLLTFSLVYYFSKIIPDKFTIISVPLGLIIGTTFSNCLFYLIITLLEKKGNILLGEFLLQTGSINLVIGTFSFFIYRFFLEKISNKNELRIK